VGAPDADRVRALGEGRFERACASNQDLVSRAQLQAGRGVEDVARGQADVHPAPGVAGRLAQDIAGRGDVVVGRALTLVDGLDGERRAVLLTGHAGFKGSWMALWLQAMGARVSGLADEVPTSPSLYELAGISGGISDYRDDVRDPSAVLGAFTRSEPEIVVHLAAQPFVRRSFTDPRGTFETNVMGTVNVLEAAHVTPSVRVVICVTTDKCYANDPLRSPRPFVESDPMGGSDPYSSSKGCAELVIEAYRRSFFVSGSGGPDGVRLASVRAGNVIGGGDWGEDRLIPDFMRGALVGEPIPVRNRRILAVSATVVVRAPRRAWRRRGVCAVGR
jgi:nucleoside-diphosphate-sugar epimerase